MKIWVNILWIGRNSYTLEILRVPVWVIVLQKLWLFFCWITRGWIAGHGLPEWGWKIPVGRAVHDQYGLVNSLGNKLSNLETNILFMEDKYKVVEVVITEDEAKKLDPEWWDEL